MSGRETARYTYTESSSGSQGSAVIYDDDSQITIHSDSCPARGSHGAFDLARLSKFSHLDKDMPLDTPMTERPSFKAMIQFAESLPEVRAQRAVEEFVDLGERPATDWLDAKPATRGSYRKLSDLLKDRTTVNWLIRDFVEAGVIALFAGPKGSYKSALVNDIAMRVALNGLPVFILSPEGNGLQRRLQGWLDEFAPGTDADTLPLYVRDRRLNLSAAEEMAALVAWLDEIEKETGKPIACIAIDTWSKATAHDEDNNTATKLLLGEIDRQLRHRGPKPATVMIVAHTGHSNQERARGASALGADTDAEYIVSFKSETVKVTRARFKDSPALLPLYFKPKVRPLDYADGEGVTAMSVVLLPASAPGAPAKGLTELQVGLLAHAAKYIEEHGPSEADPILKGIDGRGPDLRRRLTALIGRGLLLVGKLYDVAPAIVQTQDGYT
jgi:hypothetical protein